MSTPQNQFHKKSHSSRYTGFTPAQKWEEAVKLREMAWELKTAMVRSNHPDWSSEQVYSAVREIFLYATT
jgi:hypothetical protein